MSTYSVVLFVHLLAVVAAFAVSAILHLAMFRMRSAGRVEEMVVWASVPRRFGPVMPAFVIALFGTGAYLVADVWSWSADWVEVSIAGLVALAIVGAVSGERFGRTVGPLLATAPSGPPDDRLAAAVRSPVAWIGSHVATALALGVVWLMVLKPALWPSIAALAGAVVVGVASALPFCRVARPSVAAGLDPEAVEEPAPASSADR